MDRRGSGRPVELLGVRLLPGAAGIWEAAGAGAGRQGQWASRELQGVDCRGSGCPVELLGVRLLPGAAGIREAAGAGAGRQEQWTSGELQGVDCRGSGRPGSFWESCCRQGQQASGELQGPGQAGRALHTSQEGRWQKSKRTSIVPVSSPGRTGGPVTAGNHRTFLL